MNMDSQTSAQPIRVCHVSHQAERFGIGTFLLTLIKEQCLRQSQLKVGAAFQTVGEREEAFRTLGISVHQLKARSAKSPLLGWYFWRIFRDYDVIHFHTLSPWAFIAARLRRRKIITTFHGSSGLRGEWLDGIRRRFFTYILSHWCERTIFVSQSAKERFAKCFNYTIHADRSGEIANGLPIGDLPVKNQSFQTRNELGWNHRFVIGCAARFDPVKRIELLIRTIDILNNDNYLAAIAGSGDPRYENSLKSLARDLKLDNQVQFLGFRQDVLDVLANMDLFVLSSVGEPFGLSLLEAMALGVPCAVFSDSGAAVDIIGSSGFVVSTCEELADVASRLRSDPALSAQVRNRVRERASAFHISKTASRYFALYSEVCTGYRAKT